MKPSYSVLFAALITAAFAISADAQAAGGDPGIGTSAYPMDCSKAKDKSRCIALNKDIGACKDKIGDEWRECMHRPVPDTKITAPKLRDCTKASNIVRCEAHNAALEACNDKTTRAEHRRCMEGRPPAPANS